VRPDDPFSPYHEQPDAKIALCKKRFTFVTLPFLPPASVRLMECDFEFVARQGLGKYFFQGERMCRAYPKHQPGLKIMNMSSLFKAALIISVLSSICWSQEDLLVPVRLKRVAVSTDETIGERPLIPTREVLVQQFKAGDGLKITVYPDTLRFPNGTFTIDKQGYVDFPIIGRMKVTDKNSVELQQILSQAYVNFIPQTDIRVQPLIRATLLGGFLKPGLYLVDSRSSLWDLIQLGGGTLREDGISKLRWERNRKVLSKNLDTAYIAGTSLQDMGFQSGDQITVIAKPKMDGRDVFYQDVMPVMGLLTSLAAVTATILIATDNNN
jgi:protein involved in polysaccharide export with SLBB domain